MRVDLEFIQWSQSDVGCLGGIENGWLDSAGFRSKHTPKEPIESETVRGEIGTRCSRTIRRDSRFIVVREQQIVQFSRPGFELAAFSLRQGWEAPLRSGELSASHLKMISQNSLSERSIDGLFVFRKADFRPERAFAVSTLPSVFQQRFKLTVEGESGRHTSVANDDLLAEIQADIRTQP